MDISAAGNGLVCYLLHGWGWECLGVNVGNIPQFSGQFLSLTPPIEYSGEINRLGKMIVIWIEYTLNDINIRRITFYHNADSKYSHDQDMRVLFSLTAVIL